MKNNKEMVNETSEKSRAVYKSDYQNGYGDAYVIAVGYNTSGEFGYFICNEQASDNEEGYRYYDVSHFQKKVNERTYQEVLMVLHNFLLLLENQ